jgi:hypothetical protein
VKNRFQSLFSNSNLYRYSVVLREVTKPWLEWLLGMCALLGGVYTCSSLLENFVQASVRTIKRNLGKLS